MGQNDTKKREKAAQLIAEDHLSDEKIAAEVGIGRSTLARWKADLRFLARVETIASAYAKRALKHGLARKEYRLAVLNDLHQRMLQVIKERALSPDLASVPGGKTGLVTKTLKGIGKGDDFLVVEVYEVDTGTIAKICDVQKQVAEELGQLVRRSEVTEMNRLFERMSREELHDYAREGTLPDWFPVKPRQEVTEDVS
jgi:Helix-turn-helix of insertion element transposase